MDARLFVLEEKVLNDSAGHAKFASETQEALAGLQVRYNLAINNLEAQRGRLEELETFRLQSIQQIEDLKTAVIDLNKSRKRHRYEFDVLKQRLSKEEEARGAVDDLALILNQEIEELKGQVCHCGDEASPGLGTEASTSGSSYAVPPVEVSRIPAFLLDWKADSTFRMRSPLLSLTLLSISSSICPQLRILKRPLDLMENRRFVDSVWVIFIDLIESTI
jgi:hypothetical protein